MEVQKPLEVIHNSRGKRVLVELKNGKQYKGILRAYDIHLNLVLEDVEEITSQGTNKYSWIFLRGDMVLLVKPLE